MVSPETPKGAIAKLRQSPALINRLKFAMMVFNSLFLASGAMLVFLGMFAWYLLEPFMDMITEPRYKRLPYFYIFIIMGLTALVFGSLGMCFTVKRKKKLLVLYSIYLLIVLVVEFFVGYYGLKDKDVITQGFKKDFNNTIFLYESGKATNEMKQKVDHLQHKMFCCGVYGPGDWFRAGARILPQSCPGPHQQSPMATVSENKEVVSGCLQRVTFDIETNCKLIAGLGIGAAIFKSVGATLSLMLALPVEKIGDNTNQEPAESVEMKSQNSVEKKSEQTPLVK